MLIKKKILKDEDIEYLVEQSYNHKYGLGSVSKNGVTVEDTSVRSAKVAPLLTPRSITSKFVDLLTRSGEYYCPETQFLLYEKGDKYAKHVDAIGENDPRAYTIITLIEKSDNLDGGTLKLWKRGSEPNTWQYRSVELEVGETVIFPSTMVHEVEEVKQGTRKVLVVWAHRV